MKVIARRAAAHLGALGLLCALATECPAEGKARFSPNGERVAVATGSARLKLMKSDGTAAVDVTFASAIAELAFSPNGLQLAVCLEAGGAVVVDAATGAKTSTADAAGRCSDLAWSAKGDKLLYAITNTEPGDPGADVEVKIWEAAPGRARSLHVHKEPRVTRVLPPDPGPFPADGRGSNRGPGDGSGGGRGPGRKNAAIEAAPGADPTALINEQRAKIFAEAAAAEAARRQQEMERRGGRSPGPAAR